MATDTLAPVLGSPPVTASAARLLAHLWARPSGVETETWRRMAAADPALVVDVVGGFALTVMTDPPAAALLADYERRVGGPHAWPASPYESMWRDDVPPAQRHGLWPPAVSALRRIYADLGLPAPPTASVDGIAVELDALAVALDQPGTRSLARALVREHLSRWLPEFCETVAQCAGEPFYRSLAQATARWLYAAETQLGRDAAVGASAAAR